MTYEEGCPNCGKESACPCANCAEANKDKVRWVWDATGELISCGHCGYTMHADEWGDFEWTAYKKRLKAKEDAQNA